MLMVMVMAITMRMMMMMRRRRIVMRSCFPLGFRLYDVLIRKTKMIIIFNIIKRKMPANFFQLCQDQDMGSYY